MVLRVPVSQDNVMTREACIAPRHQQQPRQELAVRLHLQLDDSVIVQTASSMTTGMLLVQMHAVYILRSLKECSFFDHCRSNFTDEWQHL
jgi:hypothetical protein